MIQDECWVPVLSMQLHCSLAKYRGFPPSFAPVRAFPRFYVTSDLAGHRASNSLVPRLPLSNWTVLDIVQNMSKWTMLTSPLDNSVRNGGGALEVLQKFQVKVQNARKRVV